MGRHEFVWGGGLENLSEEDGLKLKLKELLEIFQQNQKGGREKEEENFGVNQAVCRPRNRKRLLCSRN